MPSNADLLPPASPPYGTTFHGSLFRYRSRPSSLVAFESSPPPASAAASPGGEARGPFGVAENKCILMGGLSDGLIPVPYAKRLESACHEIGWSLVQPVISSSYLGFGDGDLDRDTGEISELMRYLSCHRSGENFALVGHSTGCQNAVHFMKHGDEDMRKMTKVIALQAPVSDREHAMIEPDYIRNIQHAKQLRSENRSNEMMPRAAFWAPITASRFLSLQDVGGDDDLFSSDLTDEELTERLGHLAGRSDLKVLVAFSGADEYVPDHVDKDLLLKRLCRAMNREGGVGDPMDKEKGKKGVAIPLMLITANHNLSCGEGDAGKFVAEVTKLLKDATRRTDE